MAKKTSPWAYLTLLLAAMVGVALTPWASAQDQSQAATQGQQSSKISATGCLQQASSGNGYQLTDSASMKTYDLTAGNGVDLSAEVGHTVTVTGTSSASSSAESQPANPPAANPANPSSSGSSQPNEQLTVTKVKKVSDSCQGGGGL